MGSNLTIPTSSICQIQAGSNGSTTGALTSNPPKTYMDVMEGNLKEISSLFREGNGCNAEMHFLDITDYHKSVELGVFREYWKVMGKTIGSDREVLSFGKNGFKDKAIPLEKKAQAVDLYIKKHLRKDKKNQYLEQVKLIPSSKCYTAGYPKCYDPAVTANLDKATGNIFSKLVEFVRNALGSLIGMAIVPSTVIFSSEDAKLGRAYERMRNFDFAAKHKYAAERVEFETADKAKLDGMFFKGKEKKCILYIGGNSESYEGSARSLLGGFKHNVGDVNILTFNLRGVVESTGEIRSPKDLAIDTYTAFKYLVDVKKFNPNDIVIYGRSLGGICGNLGGALIQEEYPKAKINIFSERSLSDLGLEVRCLVGNFVPFIGGVIGKIAESILVATGWQIDSKEAFDKLKGKKCIVYHKLDGVIPFDASLYKAVKATNKSPDITRIKMREFDDPDAKVDPHFHNRGFYSYMKNQNEAAEVHNQLKRLLGLKFAPSANPKIARPMKVVV